MSLVYPPSVKLVAGLLGSNQDILQKVQVRLAQEFGPLSEQSEPVLFNQSDYYCQEMGTEILRQYISFQDLVESENLAELKIKTNEIESEYAVEGKRQVNIDPGILGLEKLVLPTTKPGSFRIYLRDGIYAQVMLMFEKKTFGPLPLTYADYGWETTIRFFNEVREDYKKALSDLQ